MKRSEKSLLNSLRNRKPSNSEEPLSNIKNALGSLGKASFNPLSKTEITLDISIQIFDIINGIWIAPAALPAALQTHIPIYLFGLTDSQAGYTNANKILPPPLGWQRFGQMIGVDNGIVGHTFVIPPLFPPAPDITLGDFCIWFINTIPIPDTFLLLTRIRCENVAYGTLLNSFASDLIYIDTIRYFVPNLLNIGQFDNAILFGLQTLFGKLHIDSMSPKLFSFPEEPQNQIIDISMKLPIDKNMIAAFNLNILCQVISWTLFISKIEPLIYKNK